MKSWRPKVVNQHSGDALFLQPDGKPFTVRHLGHKLSEHGKKIWKNFTPYDMRHWCAVARLIRAKCETGEWDCYTVKNWLGHETMSTTEGYIKYAEQYYKSLSVDWISCALKSPNVTGVHMDDFDNLKNQQTAIFGPVGTLPFCKGVWARRDLNS